MIMLAGRYELIRQLGGGGSAITFLARDMMQPSKPLCVVKQLRPHRTHPRAIKFFHKEAVILEKLGKHPQIPQLLAHFKEGNNLYIVQEFIGGKDLTNEIFPGKCLSEDDVRNLLQDILEVLSFVHKYGVIHRDIKPQNLMRRREDGKIVLIDFGSIKELGNLIVNSHGHVLSSVIVGTPGYMPKEQSLGKACLASDIYAVGMTAITALTGVKPSKLEHNPQNGEVIWLEQTQVSQDIAEVINKMVRRHFSLRYSCANDALEALNNQALPPASISPIKLIPASKPQQITPTPTLTPSATSTSSPKPDEVNSNPTSTPNPNTSSEPQQTSSQDSSSQENIQPSQKAQQISSNRTSNLNPDSSSPQSQKTSSKSSTAPFPSPELYTKPQKTKSNLKSNLKSTSKSDPYLKSNPNLNSSPQSQQRSSNPTSNPNSTSNPNPTPRSELQQRSSNSTPTREAVNQTSPIPSPPANLSRRRILQILGFTSGSFLVTILGKTLFQSSPDQVVKVDGSGNIINRQFLNIKYFTDDLDNGVTLEMAAIPGGNFWMGSSVDEEKADSSETPQHNVTVKPFLIGKFVVTQQQYEAIMSKNPSLFKGEKYPVEQVSWDDAIEFCKKLTEKTGRIYRLPSEAEWEYACRAGTSTAFHFGETITTDLANYNASNYSYADAPNGQYRGRTTEVGSFPPNSFGLYDMHGNVYEWCQDMWHKNYNGAPNDGSAWIRNTDDPRRVLRGGSWRYYADLCRSARRYYNKPELKFSHYGFRVACSYIPKLI
ncbi:MAG: SUMF1/EgtB/PvdO family nonheme iron enzyme [Cyanobacteria bacterium J06639_18]